MESKVSYAVASKYIRQKPQYYEAMGRQGWYMPSLHSALCTLSFMQNVRNGTIYCPKSSDASKSKKCFSIPPKVILMKKLHDNLLPKFQSGDYPAD